ncbi:MurR/RpiR family transcriptional regulator [Arthrobacter sp. NPDC055585]
MKVHGADESPVARRISEALSSSTPSGRRIARELLNDYPRAGLESAARLAARSGVSTPSVIRFVSSLGYAGYPEFQDRLRSELAHRHVSALEQFGGKTHEGRGAGSLDDAGRILAGSVQEAFDVLPAKAFDEAVNLLARPDRRISVIGGRFSGFLAGYLAVHLGLMRPHVDAVPDQSLARAGRSLDLDQDDVLVVYDFRRYEDATVEFARRAARQGATLILVTDHWLSPLAADAAVTLPAPVESTVPFDSLTPAMAVTEALIAALASVLGETARDRLAAAEAAYPIDRESLNETPQGGPAGPASA